VIYSGRGAPGHDSFKKKSHALIFGRNGGDEPGVTGAM